MVVNSTAYSAAAAVADEFALAPLIYDPQYPEFLLKYCLKKSIQLTVPLFDIELPVLSRIKPLFKEHNIEILVGDVWLIQLANDKWATQQFLLKHNLHTVHTSLNPITLLRLIRLAMPCFWFL